MNNENISNAMDNLSKILGYTAPNVDESSLENEYVRAARKINEYVESTGFEYRATDDDLNDLYVEFRKEFSPEILANIPDDQLLGKMFYSNEEENSCLCYMLEFHPQMREYFGSIAGGSSYKFGLFQKKETGTWISGSPRNPDELDVSAAIARGKEIRDALITGAETILSFEKLETADDYDRLDIELNKSIGKYATLAWVHKYFHMLFPDKFSVWHSSDWHNHILYAFGIKPSETYYGRSGQLAIIAKIAKRSNVFFAHAAYDLFGDIKKFCRLGTSDSNGNYAKEWRKKHIVALGWSDLGDIRDYIQGDSVNRNALQEALTSIYYQNDTRTASRKANEIATFLMSNSNTIFVAMDGETPLSLCTEIGEYYYDDSQEFAHCKSAEWRMVFSNDEKLPNKSEGLRTSCVMLKDVDNLLYLYDKLYNGVEAVDSNDEEENSENMNFEHKPRENPLYPLNQIIYGAPGTGKTYSSVEYAVAIIENQVLHFTKNASERKTIMEKYHAYVDAGQIVFTTFHQSYGYEEFIQGIRPKPTGDKISFFVADGVFKSLADTALKNPGQNYVIIIDEINRGNISKIFGELITLIESDKRWGEVNQMSVTLPLGATFKIPNNLYIIGTMNTADKSISLIDVALRRRFEFIGMYPNLDVIADDKLRTVVDSLNKYLRAELNGTDLLIGHSFFVGKKIDDLAQIMNQNIIPLLYEYFFDEEPKVRKALECISGTGYSIDKEFAGRVQIKRDSND